MRLRHLKILEVCCKNEAQKAFGFMVGVKAISQQ